MAGRSDACGVEASGAIDFQYDQEWLDWAHAIPVSLSLPLREDRYIGDPVIAVFDNLLPDNDDIRKRLAEKARADGTDAYSLLAAIGRDAALRIQLVDAAGVITALDLPATATRLLVEALREMGEGRAVALLPMEIELTTQQAADLLNMSRPFVVGLIESGVLPARMVGNQRRVPLQDVLAYKADNKARRKTALDELTGLDEQSGLR